MAHRTGHSRGEGTISSKTVGEIWGGVGGGYKYRVERERPQRALGGI